MADYNSAYTGAQIDAAIARAQATTFGWQNFQDATTASTPITMTNADTWYDLTNDAAGALTTTSYKIPSHGTIWDSSTNTFDFSSLAVGDIVRIRFDVEVTTGGANHVVLSRLAFGSSYAFANVFNRVSFKTAVTGGQIFRYFSFAMLTEDTRTNPAKFQMQSDVGGNTVKVNGWIVETQVFQ